jgi:hypothetical protein
MNKLLQFAQSQKNIDLVATRLGGSVSAFAAVTAFLLLVAHFVK